MATSHIICDAERGSSAPWAAELIEHNLLPSGAPHLKELLGGVASAAAGTLGLLAPIGQRQQRCPNCRQCAPAAPTAAPRASRSCTIDDAALYSFRLYRRLYSKKRAVPVERYAASPPPTTPLQSSTAYTALYSVIQLYTALYSVIQHCIKIVYYTAIQPIQHTELYNHESPW